MYVNKTIRTQNIYVGPGKKKKKELSKKSSKEDVKMTVFEQD